MEQEYNWRAILYGSVPASIVAIMVFSSNISRNWKFGYLIPIALAAAGITYFFDRKRQNIFTSAFVVLMAALIIHGLRLLGWL